MKELETRGPLLSDIIEKPSYIFQNLKYLDEQISSAKLLRIFSAADYYTTNTSLMQEVPPIHVDIILDRYLLNVLPVSLIPTAGYVFLLVISAWILTDIIYHWLQSSLRSDIKLRKS